MRLGRGRIAWSLQDQMLLLGLVDGASAVRVDSGCVAQVGTGTILASVVAIVAVSALALSVLAICHLPVRCTSVHLRLHRHALRYLPMARHRHLANPSAWLLIVTNLQLVHQEAKTRDQCDQICISATDHLHLMLGVGFLVNFLLKLEAAGLTRFHVGDIEAASLE